MKILRALPWLLSLVLLAGCSVFSPAKLAVSTNDLDLGLNSSATFTVRNSGSATGITLDAIRSSQGWLSVLTADGTGPVAIGPGDPGKDIIKPGESRTYLAAVDRQAPDGGLGPLSPGTYQGRLTITSSAGTATIGVSMVVSGFSAPDGCQKSALPLQQAVSPFPSVARQQRPRYVPGELLIRYKPAAGGFTPQAQSTAYRSTASAVAASYQLTLLEAGYGDAPDVVRLSSGMDPESAAKLLERDPRVAYAEPNLYLYPQALPNDPYLSSEWNLCDFGLPQAWSVETGSSTVAVAVIDDGVDTSHPEFAGRVLPGYDFCANANCTATDNDPTPAPCPPSPPQAHGTHVAGIVLADGNNAQGIASVAYNGVKLLPVKVFSNCGGGATVDIVAKAIRWAAGVHVAGIPDNPNRAQIINLSLGQSGDSDTLNSAIADARGAGAIVIAAAGNAESGDPYASSGIYTPANAKYAIAVGSVDSNYQRSYFSKYSIQGKSVTLMAPGGFSLTPNACSQNIIISTFPVADNSYGCEAGTSMAAPFVAGVAALVWSQHPKWSAAQVTEKLEVSTYENPSWGKREYGYGVVCADKALGMSTTCGM